MAKIANREDFKDYCMRRLGAPVQQINVNDDQVEDRIDDALLYYRDYHYDGASNVYLKYQVTGQDVINGYITIPDEIMEIQKIIPGGGLGFGGSINNWMTPQYAITMDAVFNMTSISLVPYFITMNHLAELSFMFDQTPGIQFSKVTNRLTLNAPLGIYYPEGTFIAMNATSYIDPNTFAEVWDDRWLKSYATALIKKQWGENAKLFSGVILLGNVTLNAQAIWEEANAEITLLEHEMQTSFRMPIMDDIG